MNQQGRWTAAVAAALFFSRTACENKVLRGVSAPRHSKHRRLHRTGVVRVRLGGLEPRVSWWFENSWCAFIRLAERPDIPLFTPGGAARLRPPLMHSQLFESHKFYNQRAVFKSIFRILFLKKILLSIKLTTYCCKCLKCTCHIYDILCSNVSMCIHLRARVYTLRLT